MKNVTTAYLLTCAVIGVASGIMLTAANWLTTALSATVPFLSVAMAGLWLLPAIVALRLLERPLAGILVGLISGLVASPLSGYGFGSVLTNVWWAFFAEIGFLVVLYRFWTIWQYYAGAVVVGVVYPILAWQWFNLGTLAPWAVASFFAIVLGSALAGVFLGVFIADRLRAAGVAKLARRRPRAPRAEPAASEAASPEAAQA
ncbi:ECF transporter S component [uncultured Microbacterium sp.]|uniref:ECF transporter S component n=1 Tax=uncultured Microbacterium sp. TaxID=191216 RepID=UPI0025F548DE|nr:ECF transporter S component [uncultured Microbacterium sp.]